jgi:hypothetical protein
MLSLSSSVRFLLGFLLDCEYEGKMFLRNINKHATDYMALQSRILALIIFTMVKISGLAHAVSVPSAGSSIHL